MVAIQPWQVEHEGLLRDAFCTGKSLFVAMCHSAYTEDTESALHSGWLSKEAIYWFQHCISRGMYGALSYWSQIVGII